MFKTPEFLFGRGQNPMYRFLLVLTISSAIGLQAWRTLFNNFAVEVAALDGAQVGIIQSVREIPGFLALLAVYCIMVMREHRLSALSILVLGIGLGATGLFPSYVGLVATTLLFSFGFHYYETTNQSLTLQYFDTRTAPLVFGRLRSLAAVANIGIGVAIYLAEPYLSYTQLYLVIGVAVVLTGLWGLSVNPSRTDIVPQRKQMVFRRAYLLFYTLTFLAGARRQIFIAFSVLLMVQEFAFTVQEVAALFVANNVVNYFVSPMIGRAIVRFGERKVLSLEYFSLIFVFVGYAFTDSKLVVALLYILDHIFFNFAMAIRTYFQKVGDPRDFAPTMAVGFTINHIAAVFLPALGGIFWMIDYRIPFLAGAVLSLISLGFVQQVKVSAPPRNVRV